MKGFMGLTGFIPAFREEEKSTQQIHASWIFPFPISITGFSNNVTFTYSFKGTGSQDKKGLIMM